jgi:predicted acylesterase/phospholipase RssA
MSVIRELKHEKIPVDVLVGTSDGSLNGAIHANDQNSFEPE